MDGTIELCGFGPIVAAARTASLLSATQADSVVLAGIAGGISDALETGEAYEFSRVSCYGIGVGSSADFQSSSQIGWPQWPGEGSSQQINDRLELCSTTDNQLELLTACAGSANSEDVSNRLTLFPKAAAEDMEAFGVAAACQLTGQKLTVVRGISNRAGDRDKQNWKIAESLDTAALKLLELLEASES